MVPRRATLEPAPRTRAKATLPKLPSPMSLMISKRSSRAVHAPRFCEERPLWLTSCATVILKDRGA